MDWNEYLKPELSVLIPVLYLVGAALKKTSVGDWRIPFLLGGGGILLAALDCCRPPSPATDRSSLRCCFPR